MLEGASFTKQCSTLGKELALARITDSSPHGDQREGRMYGNSCRVGRRVRVEVVAGMWKLFSVSNLLENRKQSLQKRVDKGLLKI